MNKASSQWSSYFANVNGKLASIALDLSLQKRAPVSKKPVLLWVWVYLQAPKANGLSDQVEFEALSSIEDELTKHIGSACECRL
jgi:hypothetical protein